MIILIKNNATEEQMQNLSEWLTQQGYGLHISHGDGQTILGLVGDTSRLDIDLVRALDIVEDVKRIQEPYKNANRKFHPADTVIEVAGKKIGGGRLLHCDLLSAAWKQIAVLRERSAPQSRLSVTSR